MEQHAEAVALLRPTLEAQRRTFPAGHPYLALTAGELAVGLARMKDLDAAEPLLRESVAIRAESSGTDNPLLMLPLLNLGTLELRQGKSDEAVQHGFQVLGILRSNAVRGGRFVDSTVRLLCGGLSKLPSSEERTRQFADLRAAAEELGASAAEVAGIAAAEARR
jgi:hypothetical protein